MTPVRIALTVFTWLCLSLGFLVLIGEWLVRRFGLRRR